MVPELCEWLKRTETIERWQIIGAVGLLVFMTIKTWIDAESIKQTWEEEKKHKSRTRSTS